MPPAAAPAVSADLILGRYRPLRPLGSGGSGAVWLVRDEEHGHERALKMVAREGMAAARAEREARAAAGLRHENCLRALALARDARHVYIAYEYVPGLTMREAMRAGRLTDKDAVEAAAQICDALAYAHARGIVHRDVKPSNVLLAEGETLSVRLLDFGLAMLPEAETLTAAGDVPGTLAYISPERLAGDNAGAPADVWAVGVLLWEALAGVHPFWNGSLHDTARSIKEGPPPLEEQRPDLPDALLVAVARATSVDPSRRPTAERLAQELRGLRRRRSGNGAAGPVAETRELPIRLASAGLAGLTAGWGAAVLPFYPAHWPIGLAAVATALAFLSERAGLALALMVPIFPLANLSLGLAIVYAALALGWLALSWRDARSGLFLALGPLLAPLAALGALPLLAQSVRGRARRAAQVAAAVLIAGVVAGLRHASLPFTGEAPPLGLGIVGSDRPEAVVHALADALQRHPALPVEALLLGLAAAAIPWVRRRGPWPIAGFGAAVMGATLLAEPAAAALPIVLAVWATCAVLVLEDAR
jgi:Protein kinase domain